MDDGEWKIYWVSFRFYVSYSFLKYRIRMTAERKDHNNLTQMSIDFSIRHRYYKNLPFIRFPNTKQKYE